MQLAAGQHGPARQQAFNVRPEGQFASHIILVSPGGRKGWAAEPEILLQLVGCGSGDLNWLPAENRLKQYWQVTPCSSVGVLSNTGTATGKCGVLRFGDVCRISLRVIDLAGFTISIIRFWMQLLLQWNLITGWIFTKPDYGGVFWSKYCILRVASQSASSE